MFYLQRAEPLVQKKRVQCDDLWGRTLRNAWKQHFTQRSGHHRTQQSQSDSGTSVSRSGVLVQWLCSKCLWAAFIHLNWRHKSLREKMVQEADKRMKGGGAWNDRSSEDGVSGRTRPIHQELNMQKQAGLWEWIETSFWVKEIKISKIINNKTKLCDLKFYLLGLQAPLRKFNFLMFY